VDLKRTPPTFSLSIKIRFIAIAIVIVTTSMVSEYYPSILDQTAN
jgi:hypothetical protein